MRFLTALVAGLLFGSGLLISGMTNPANVLAFLDLAGEWRPTLAFVMGGAVLAAAPAFFYARRHRRTPSALPIRLPNRTLIDTRLVFGSSIFGIGWGLSGICPGPALILLTSGSAPAFVFVGTVIVGMWLTPAAREPTVSTQS